MMLFLFTLYTLAPWITELVEQLAGYRSRLDENLSRWTTIYRD